MKRSIRLPQAALMACLGGVLTSGCATAINGVNQMIPIHSSPAGATACVDGELYTTPCVVALARKTDHSVEISKDGYESQMFQITRSPTGATLGNVFVGGLIGLGVDAATGANNRLVPESINVTLTPGEDRMSDPQLAGMRNRPRP